MDGVVCQERPVIRKIRKYPAPGMVTVVPVSRLIGIQSARLIV